ncbi:MAG: cell division protein SepF [Acutalibacter sp.]|nr:cell division protein SepF [Acutalibacter sp.]
MASFRDKIQRVFKPPDDEYEEYYDEEEQEYEEPRRSSSYVPFYTRTDPRENKVVNFNAKSQQQMVVFKPSSFGEETRNIADELLQRHTVVLNLEKTDKETSRRIVDFLSGVAYANNGRLKPIASNIVIVTPYNVDLTGDDVLDELESSGIYF